MPERTSVLVEDRFDMPIAQAWPFFADFPGLAASVPGCTVTATGSGVGMVRHVSMNGATMDEQLEEMDEAIHRVVYKIPDGPSGRAFYDYVAEMQLTPDGPNACRFRWQSRFTVPDGGNAEQMRAGLKGAYAGSIEAFRKA